MRTTWSGQTKIEFTQTTVDKDIASLESEVMALDFAARIHALTGFDAMIQMLQKKVMISLASAAQFMTDAAKEIIQVYFLLI